VTNAGLAPAHQQHAKNAFHLQHAAAGENAAGAWRYRTQKGVNDTALATAQMQADASRYPHDLAMQRFNAVFPHLTAQQGALQRLLQGSAGVGGAQPAISQSPLYSQQGVQEQVNKSRAANDAATFGRVRDMRAGLAGRGAGAQSPLASQLEAMYQGQNLQANTQQESDLRFRSQEGNARHLLAAQQAAEQQYASRQEEDIRRRQVGAQAYAALVSALAGLA
jgi:hypothetical protein